MFSNGLFRIPNKAEYKTRLVDLGIHPAIVNTVIQANIIKDYEHLCQQASCLTPLMRDEITSPWELFVLSGERDAFNEAMSNYKLDASSVGKRDINPLHYAALSGNTDLLMAALKLSIPFNSATSDNFNVLHFAILSRSLDQINKVLELEKTFEQQLPRTASYGINVFHLAAFTGDIDVLKKAEPLIENFHVPDHFDFTALNYAIKNGNQRVQKALRDMGLTYADPATFTFGEIRHRHIVNNKDLA